MADFREFDADSAVTATIRDAVQAELGGAADTDQIDRLVESTWERLRERLNLGPDDMVSFTTGARQYLVTPRGRFGRWFPVPEGDPELAAALRGELFEPGYDAPPKSGDAISKSTDEP